MKTMFKSAAARGGLAFAVALGLSFGFQDESRADPAGGPDAQLVKAGEYVAVLGDCAACHTAPGGKPYAGGLPLGSPIGKIYSTNITPDRETGIGSYSFEDFERAVRHGVRQDGKTLYPAMPYPDFARISDQDMHSLYAYFTSSVTPVNAPNKAADITWPLSVRWPLAFWRLAFAPKVQATPASTSGDAVADRGAYLVEGPGHCGTCHTPRGFGLQQKAMSPADGSDYLSGAPIDGYVASNLRGDKLTGLGSWSEDDIVTLLRSGRNAHTAVFGGMAAAVSQSTQHMTDGDLQAIAHYLKTLPASPGDKAFAYDPTVAKELYAGKVERQGALTYVNNCAACHLTSGKGYTETFPALAGNPVVNGPDPTSLIHIVLSGAMMPGTHAAPTRFAMPPFGDRLSDQEVADVVTFIRTSWGNQGSAVDAAAVAKFRKLMDPSPKAESAKEGPPGKS